MFDFSLQRMKALICKEFIQLKRDRPTLVMIVMLPIIQLLLFGYAINMDPKHMPAAVISRDNTFLTRSLTAALENRIILNLPCRPQAMFREIACCAAAT